MLKVALIVLAAGLFVADKDDEAAKKDLKKLEGTWRLESQTADGKETPAEDAKKITIVFDAAGKWKVESEGTLVLEGTVKLDPSKKPRAADYTVTTEGPARDKVANAIYEVEGDIFKHCFTVDKDRPDKFESKEGSGVTYAVFKRVKK